MAGGPEVTAALKLRDDMSGPLKTAGQNVGGFSSILKGAASTALGFLGADVIHNVGEFVKGAIEASAQSDRLQKQTDAVIKSTGGASAVTAQHVGDLAESLKRLSGVQDETIRGGENLLLTFTSIQNKAGKGNDIFDQATKTMLNMSVALGEDSSSAAIQLGKALNDPINGVTALRRVGVSFTESQLEQIKTMQKSGNIMGAQKIILAELTKEFGGSAEAAGNSAQGMLDKASNAIDDARKALANLLLPAIGEVAGGFAKVANSAVDWLQANQPLVDQITGFVGGGLTELFSLIGSGVSVVSNIVGIFNSWHDVMGATATAGDNVAGVINSLSARLGVTGDQTSEIATAFGGLVDAYVGGLGPVFTDLGTLWNTVIVPALGQLRDGLITLEPRFTALLTKLAPVVKVLMQLYDVALKNLIAGLKVLLPPAINLVVAIFGTLMDAVGVVADTFMSLVNLFDDLIHGRWSKIWGDLESVFTTAVGGVLKIVADLVVGVGQFFGQLVDGIAGSSGAIPTMWAAVVGWFSSLPDAILSAIGNLADLLTAPAMNLIDGFLTMSITSWEAAAAWFLGIPGSILDALGDLGTLLVDGAAGLISGFLTSAIGAWPTVSAWFTGLPGEILSGLGDLGQLLADDAIVLIGGFLETLIVEGPKVIAWAEALPGQILDGIGDIATVLGDDGLALIDGFLTSAAAEWPVVLAWVQGLPQEILTGIGDLSVLLLDTAVNLISGLLTGGVTEWLNVAAWLRALPQAILDGIGDLSATLTQKGLDLLQGFLTAEIRGWQNIGNWLGDTGTRAVAAVGNLITTLGTQGLALMTGFLNAEVQGWKNIGAWLAGVPDRVVNAIGGLAGTLTSAGNDLVNGFLNGIKNVWWKITSWVHNELMKLPQVVRDALGIKSPSTVMAAIGENFTAGLQLGITRSWGNLRRTVGALQVGTPRGFGLIPSPALISGGFAGSGRQSNVRDVYLTIEGGYYLDSGPSLDHLANTVADRIRSSPGT